MATPGPGAASGSHAVDLGRSAARRRLRQRLAGDGGRPPRPRGLELHRGAHRGPPRRAIWAALAVSAGDPAPLPRPGLPAPAGPPLGAGPPPPPPTRPGRARAPGAAGGARSTRPSWPCPGAPAPKEQRQRGWLRFPRALLIGAACGAAALLVTPPLAGLVVAAAVILGLLVPWARAIASVAGIAAIVAGAINVVQGQNVHHYLSGSNWAASFVNAGNLDLARASCCCWPTRSSPRWACGCPSRWAGGSCGRRTGATRPHRSDHRSSSASTADPPRGRGRRPPGQGRAGAAASSASASRARRAVASQVNQRARASAPLDSRLRSTSSPRTRPSAPARSPQVVHQQARLAVEHGVGVAGDGGGHGRGATGGRLGQRHAPALALRAAGHDPGPAVPVHELLVVDAAGQAEPLGGAELVAQRLERRALVALADDDRPQRRVVRLDLGQRRAAARRSASPAPAAPRPRPVARPTAGRPASSGRPPRAGPP